MVEHGSHNQPAGTWSDDTSMALATCDSIRAVSAIMHAHAISCEAYACMAHVARRLVAGEEPRDVAGVPESEIRSGGFVLDTERAAL